MRVALPTSLPQPLTSFIGREQEIAAIWRLLAGARLLTLTGTGGSGKTRLALQVAAAVADDFRDGVLFVPLAALRDPALVIPTVAGALGLTEAGGRPLVESLKQHLRDRQLLLVLDNFEQVSAAAPAVADLLEACPEVRALISSRAALHVYGEQEFAVPPLALPPDAGAAGALPDSEAVRLFVARARENSPDFQLTPENAAAVVEICRRLDGLPLAIELAAARLKILSPAAMLARLVDSAGAPTLRLLTGGARNLPPRQQTLREAIAWSYDLLDPAEQALFRRLAVFAGGCTLEAAEAVADESGSGAAPPILDGVASLIDKSLLVRAGRPNQEPRFTMLATIREYGLERLEESGEAVQVRDRHAAYYQALATSTEPALRGRQQVAWLAQLEAEHDNLRAALGWTLERQDIPAALRMAGALGWFWNLRGHFSEGRAWLERVMAVVPLDAQTQARALVLNWAGVLAFRQGDIDRAAALLQESAAIFRAVGDSGGLAYALVVLGLIVLYQGDPARARRLLEESVARFRTEGNTWGVALALRNLGEVATTEGDPAARRALLEDSVRLFRAVGDNWGLALALNNAGDVVRGQGDAGQAAHLLAESLALFRELGDKQGIAWCLAQMAGAAAQAGQAERAARIFGAVAALLESIDARLDPVDRAEYTQNVAAVRAHLGEPAFAAAWAEGAALSLDAALADAAAPPTPAVLPALAPSAAAGPDALTPREIDVLRLLAAGLTDAQIAGQLSLSARTVQTHVRSIYSKLDLTTRSAATRYAIEHHLA
jgi:non-specific serine/threonine protein kinase